MWNESDHPLPEKAEELQREESAASSPLPMAPEGTPVEPKPAIMDEAPEAYG